jgi:hypothetical protein
MIFMSKFADDDINELLLVNAPQRHLKTARSIITLNDVVPGEDRSKSVRTVLAAYLIRRSHATTNP